MTRNDAGVDECRLAAEVLARQETDVLHVVRSDGGEAAAIVFDDSNDGRRAATIAETDDGAGYSVYGTSSFERFDDAPAAIVDEPFRGRTRLSGGAASVEDAVWRLAEDGVAIDAGGVSFTELDADLRAAAEDYRDTVTDDAATPARVIDLEMRTPAAPTQWYGLTEDARPVYIRFRGGRLQARVGGRRGVDGENVHDEQVGDGFDPAIEAERLDEIVPEDVMVFDVDLDAVEDIDDMEFDASNLDELASDNDGYDPDRAFARRCRQVAGTAETFEKACNGLIAADAYRAAHPDHEAGIDREAHAGRGAILRIICGGLRDAAAAVDEDGDYATAATLLGEIDGVLEQARGEFRRDHGLPVDAESMPDERVNAIAGGQYRRVFHAVSDLHERAEYEREN